jgi:hypothetical protein
MIRVKSRRPTKSTQSDVASKDILTGLVAEEPTRFFEMYYWSREPGMLEIMRAVMSMSETSRAALEAFLTMSQEPALIVANWDRQDSLTLTSPQIGQTVAIIHYCAENEDIEKPSLPN